MHLATFIKQKSYEHVIYVLRHHWITFVPTIFMFLVLLSVPFLLRLLFHSLFPTLFNGPILHPLTILAVSIYYLSIYLFFFAQFIEFYLDLTIVSNDRVIDVEQRGLFSRTISELDLFRIQDVTSDIHGVFPTLLNYGDVTIKTASTNVNLIAHAIPHPNKIREDLIQLSHEDRKYHPPQLKEAEKDE